MRINKPIYRNLDACRDRSDEEVKRLTREVYRRNPKLAFYPLIACFILSPVAFTSPRFLETWFELQKIWSLLIAGAIFGIPMIVFERTVHFPAVNRAMQKLIAEEGVAPNGGHGMQSGNSDVTKGPPPVS